MLGYRRKGVGLRRDTDFYLDATGVTVAPQAFAALAKSTATVGNIAVHYRPVELDFAKTLRWELTIVSMGYPAEIDGVTDDIVAADNVTVVFD